MCGIAGALDLRGQPVPELAHRLKVMSELQAHRGPDAHGIWMHEHGHVGLASRRLAVIDPAGGAQPMIDRAGRVIVYNGAVYNHRTLGGSPAGTSDTQALLEHYGRRGVDCLGDLRGMFAFALWDEPQGRLLLARDRLGIKPLHYATVDGVLYFASEAKALLPFLPALCTDQGALEEYLAFQFCLGEHTLFADVSQLPAAHYKWVGQAPVRYWDVTYELDMHHTTRYFEEEIRELLAESVNLHLRADVPIACHLSGGLDSSALTALAGVEDAYIGVFGDERYDETPYARALADHCPDVRLHEVPIGRGDFGRELKRLIWHLDYPVAGPGAFAQFMLSATIAEDYKVVLAGQGGDELFGGYARYLIAYFEQCLKAAIEGTTRTGNFVVTYESIISSLGTLRDYRPLLQSFWQEGLFEDLDARYFRLICRQPTGRGELFERFRELFNGPQVGHQAYFDKMTHFDSKTLLPALLHVEDRVSMAHGLEARVPLLDHRLVQLAATIPADIKFRDGELKHIFRRALAPLLPAKIAERRDKVGFAFPWGEWLADNENTVVAPYCGPFDRRAWGLVCLRLWHEVFHGQAGRYRALIQKGMSNESDDHRRRRIHRLAPG